MRIPYGIKQPSHGLKQTGIVHGRGRSAGQNRRIPDGFFPGNRLKIIIQLDLVAGNETDITFAGVRMHQGGFKVENSAFIDTVFRYAAVYDPFLDQDDIACPGKDFPIIQKQAQRAALNLNQFHFLMPVEGHVIAGMVLIHMIKGDGEIRGAMFYFFIIIQIMHSFSSEKAPAEASAAIVFSLFTDKREERIKSEYCYIFCHYNTGKTKLPMLY